MRQYNQIKAKYPETILLFRLGDFFETFNEDAHITAKVCGIALTKRNNGAAGDMPLAGFPHHQLDTYLPKIVRAGYRVAVCEQLEDPKQARGIVKRGVTEVVTPGVALYEKLLDTKKNNFVAGIVLIEKRKGERIAGIAAADISTGEFIVSELPSFELPGALESIAPAELLISKAQRDEIKLFLEDVNIKPAITRLEEWVFEEEFGRENLLRHFRTKSLKGFGIESMGAAIAAAGAVMYYFGETQQGRLEHLRKIGTFNPSEFMPLDFSTRRNLEITYSFSESAKDGSLIGILDKTKTAMGGRLFKKWVTRPLINVKSIKKRQDAVSAFFENAEKRDALRQTLTQIGDLERLISKISTGRANPRDAVSLKDSLEQIPGMKQIIGSLNSGTLSEIAGRLKEFDELKALIGQALLDEPSTALGSGNVFRPGYCEELDGYIEAKHSGKDWIAEYREKQREESGIPSLKVGYNSVFGYYIEVTKVHSKKVPEHYQRKQTLTNSERYTTAELKEFESKILSAEENIEKLEQELFAQLREKISEHTLEIQDCAAFIAAIDCLQSFAEASAKYAYTLPKIDDSEKLMIKGGRHPVVERLLPVGESYTSNSTKLDTENEQIHIITGPNMSGKSCYLRQVALIVLLGQIGCYVPAEKASFGIVDRIFTRVGAQDNITAGESTFLVEMQEAANILNNATRKSLILLDEVGRGTATYDGISIAWAITEYLHNAVHAKTLFATHYHELNELASRYERIVNYRVEVIEAGSTVVFAHNVKKGQSDHSFGIYVAKMAGLPQDVTGRADEIMKIFEESRSGDGLTSAKADVKSIATQKEKSESEQLAIFEFRDDTLRDKLINLKINSLTPVQAMQVLAEMQKEAKKGKKR